jgi:spermidine synthase
LSKKDMSSVTYRWLSRTAFVLLGAFSIVVQAVFLREFLVVFFGNELAIGVIFANWVLGIFLGGWAGAALAKRIASPLRAFSLGLLWLCLVAPVEVWLIRSLRVLLGVPAGSYVAFFPLLLSSAVIIAPFAVAVGLVFPLACKIAVAEKQESVQIGQVYIWEALGFMAGGALFTFVLVDHLNAFAILLVLVVAVAAANVALNTRLVPWPRSRVLALANAAMLLAALLLLLSHQSDRWNQQGTTQRWASIVPETQLLHSLDSRYQNIAIGYRADQYLIYLDGQYASSFPDPYTFSSKAHLWMCLHPRPAHVLLVGGGAEGLVAELLRHPVQQLDYVQLDPRVLEAIRDLLPADDRRALADPRLRIHFADGRHFVWTAPAHSYDLILLDLPDPTTAFLNRFYTREFFSRARQLLKADGLLITGVSSALNYFGEEMASFTGSIYQTLHEVFPVLLVVPGERNYFVAANRAGVATFDLGELARRFDQRHIETPYFSSYHFSTLLEPPRVRFVAETLSGLTPLPANTDFRPISYFFNLVLWDRFAGREAGGFLQLLSHARAWWFCLLLAVLVGIRLLTGHRGGAAVAAGRTRFNALAAIAAAGFTGMALEIVLIFAFQNLYGYVYEKIGLIVALFMVGLAAGGALANRALRRNGLDAERWLAAVLLFFAAFSALLPLATSTLGQTALPLTLIEGTFFGLLLLAGVLTGLTFPLGNDLYLAGGGSLGVAAGKTVSADHLGAMGGALLTGLILVPVLGTWAACGLVALVNLAACLLLLHQRWVSRAGSVARA